MRLLAILCVLPIGCTPILAAPPKFQNTGYSRSYGKPDDWQRYLNAENAVPAWTHYRANTAYTRQPGRESLGHYLTGK